MSQQDNLIGAMESATGKRLRAASQEEQDPKPEQVGKMERRKESTKPTMSFDDGQFAFTIKARSPKRGRKDQQRR